jgi:hypothetical protein
MANQVVRLMSLSSDAVNKFGIRYPGKPAKAGITLYYVNNGMSAPMSIQLPPLSLAFAAAVTESSQNKERCTIALSVSPDSEAYKKLAAIDLAIIRSFLAQRDKDTVLKKYSDDDVISECIGGVRAPPEAHPEYSPTFRANVDVRCAADGNYFLDTDRCRIYDIKRKVKTDVECIAQRSSIIVTVKPGWVWTGSKGIGITWIAENIMILDEPNADKFPFAEGDDIPPPPIADGLCTQPGSDTKDSRQRDPAVEDEPDAKRARTDETTEPDAQDIEALFEAELANA